MFATVSLNCRADRQSLYLFILLGPLLVFHNIPHLWSVVSLGDLLKLCLIASIHLLSIRQPGHSHLDSIFTFTSLMVQSYRTPCLRLPEQLCNQSFNGQSLTSQSLMSQSSTNRSLGREGLSTESLNVQGLDQQDLSSQIEHRANTPQLSQTPQARSQRSIGARAMVSSRRNHIATSCITKQVHTETDCTHSAGCYTCRLRRKKCDEKQPTCQACDSLGVTCEYKKPSWWISTQARTLQTDKIKRRVRETKVSKKEQALHGRHAIMATE